MLHKLNENQTLQLHIKLINIGPSGVSSTKTQFVVYPRYLTFIVMLLVENKWEMATSNTFQITIHY